MKKRSNRVVSKKSVAFLKIAAARDRKANGLSSVCGICGIVNRPGSEAPDRELLKRMIGRLAHRGPDGTGYFRDRRAGIGHARLSIVDVTGGAQPLSNEDGTLWVTFNGEIFNYRELAAQLMARGHVFATRSDTEVIVHAWEEWGAECFRRFNGQWAIGLWDTRKRSLVLSRDRVGIRPLYYAVTPERLLFGSEVKAIFADRSVSRSFDPAGLAEVFSFWCPVAPRTVFTGVREVRPGHYLSFDADDFLIEERPYWSIGFNSVERNGDSSIESAAEELASKLADATRLRFTRSDVPVGAYLSGGLDSSVTTAVVAGETDAPVTTFSLRFSDDEFDEGGFQHAMVKRLGTVHHEVHARPSAIGEVFPDVIFHAERPILRTAPAPLFLLSQLARDNGFKVVVTGEGADEVLAGYDIFRELKARLSIASDPSSERRAAIVARLYPWMARTPGQVPAFAHAFFAKNLDVNDPAVSHRPRWDSTAALTGLLRDDVKAQVAAVPADTELLARLPQESPAWDAIERAQWLEMTTLLPGYILSAQGDRMLMAHSVEGRFPFLDHNVIEFAASLPPSFKLFGFDEKHILKRACAGLVPPEILSRPKQPYRAPDAGSFFSPHPPEWLDDVLSRESISRAGIFRPEIVEKLLEKCRHVSGTGMSNTDNMRLVGVISTMLAHRQFIENDGRPPGGEPVFEPGTVIDRV